MLLELVWPEAYAIARSTLGQFAAAEDVAQEACARALVSITTLKDPGRFSVWFYRIVVNETITQYRKLARLDALRIEAAARYEDDATEDRLDVRRAIDSLPLHLRATIVLFYYADLSTAEIATVMGISPVAVRLRLMLARRRLRSLLREVAIATTFENPKGGACPHEHEPAQ
jgi:RNA polymerase sigma-70 factor, ECF subfamily